jgi:AcrR family transcriptional regulator
LVDAMTRAASECSYESLDIEQIARYAGLSADEFYCHFPNKDQCLLAAYDRFLERMNEHIDDACEGVSGWPERVKLAIEAAFDFITELDGVARVFAVDAVRTGAPGIERRRASIDRAAEELKEGRRLYPATAKYPKTMERTLIAGLVLTVASHLLAENAEDLPDLEPEAVELVLTPYIGSQRARRLALA